MTIVGPALGVGGGSGELEAGRERELRFDNLPRDLVADGSDLGWVVEGCAAGLHPQVWVDQPWQADLRAGKAVGVGRKTPSRE